MGSKYARWVFTDNDGPEPLPAAAWNVTPVPGSSKPVGAVPRAPRFSQAGSRGPHFPRWPYDHQEAPTVRFGRFASPQAHG